MNKEEIEERISYAKSNFTDGIEIFLEIIEKQQKELEQKESILDKVTDKLKEDIKIYGNHEERKHMCKEQLYENDGKWFHAKEILNIIEGEKE